ncbi:MAG: flagellin [Candidatus Velthaea sp.]
MDVLGLGGQVSLAQGRTQAELGKAVERLSSGLRINTAADDPSGLAVAESLQAKVAGLDQGTRSIQDANNALNVVTGALQSVGAILQRMRSLVVEARSGLLTADDRSNLQAEIDQLRTEIGQISNNTTFNGKKLLDGSNSSASTLPGRLLIVQNDGLSTGGTLLDTTLDPAQPSLAQPAPQVIQTLHVDSYDPVANQLTVTAVISSPDPLFGPAQTASFTVDNNTNFQSGFFPPTVGTPSFTQTDQSGNTVLAFNIGTLTQNDVGLSAIVVSLDAEVKAAGQALQVNSGDGEGTVVSIDIPAVNTINLGVNGVQLSSDDLVNAANEYRIDYGITHLASIEAQVGAQTVAMQETANANNIDAVNTQAAESLIRDTDIGTTMTAFTKDQILNNVQTEVLSKLYASAPQILALVRGAGGA